MAAFAGYPGTIFQTAWLAMQWLSGILAGGSAAPAAVASAAENVYATLNNGATAVIAQQTLWAWQFEFAGLQAIAALPLSLDPTAQAVFDARIATYAAALSAFPALIPVVNPVKTVTLLTAGAPAIPDPGLIEFYSTFTMETPPIAVTPATLLTVMLQNASAWAEIAAEVQSVQGAQTTQAFDVATRQTRILLRLAEDVFNFVSGPFASTDDPTWLWNQMVVLPSMTETADTSMSAPYSQQNQQGGVIRYILRSLMDQLALLLLSLRQPNFATAKTAPIFTGESLMDFASRTTGDFENWREIAALNGLQPPYVAAAASPGVAGWGNNLLLPTTTGVPLPAGLPPPNYENNVLGIDWYLGKPGWPVSQPMPAWRGDFELTSGYDNLRVSLGRRILTSRGALLFHRDYGSRIPPEVGAVQFSDTAGHIAAYGQSALQSDPRVAKVLSSTAAIPAGGKGEVDYAGSVQPVGLDQTPVLVNEVLGALP